MHAKRLLKHWLLLSLILLSMLGCKSNTESDEPPQKFKFPPLVWAKALVALIKPTIPDTATTLEKQALKFQSKGRLELAEKHYRQALIIREQGWGADHLYVTPGLDLLVAYYTTQGKYAEAIPFVKRALEIRERWLGPLHPDVATTLDKYAELLRQTEHTAEAVPYEQRAQAIRGNK